MRVVVTNSDFSSILTPSLILCEHFPIVVNDDPFTGVGCKFGSIDCGFLQLTLRQLNHIVKRLQ